MIDMVLADGEPRLGPPRNCMRCDDRAETDSRYDVRVKVVKCGADPFKRFCGEAMKRGYVWSRPWCPKRREVSNG